VLIVLLAVGIVKGLANASGPRRPSLPVDAPDGAQSSLALQTDAGWMIYDVQTIVRRCGKRMGSKLLILHMLVANLQMRGHVIAVRTLA
jgi:hypothetical protein